jgi:hypothetical protein
MKYSFCEVGLRKISAKLSPHLQHDVRVCRPNDSCKELTAYRQLWINMVFFHQSINDGLRIGITLQ